MAALVYASVLSIMFNARRFYTSAYVSQNSPVKWILIASLVCFVFQNILEGLNQPSALEPFVVSGRAISSGYVWTLLSYSLFHGGILHLFLNILGLYFMGKPLELNLGPKRFLTIYISSLFIGALAWLSLHYQGSTTLIGASAGILGLLTYFCCLYPDQAITLLLFFILPVQLRPKWLILGTLGFEVFGLCMQELKGVANVANSAHLGGMLAGYICFWLMERKNVSFSWNKTKTTLHKPKWLKLKKRFSPQAFTVNISEKELLRIEVDRILDKINQEGFGALNSQEKEVLDKAKEFLKQ